MIGGRASLRTAGILAFLLTGLAVYCTDRPASGQADLTVPAGFTPSIPAPTERSAWFDGEAYPGRFEAMADTGFAIVAASEREAFWHGSGFAWRAATDGLSVTRESATALPGDGPAFTGDTLLQPGSDGSVTAGRPADGVTLWRAEGRAGRLGAAGGLAFWVDVDGRFRVRSAADGSAPAEADLTGVDPRVPVAFDGVRFYLALLGGQVVALDAERLTPSWRSDPYVTIRYLVADSLRVYAFGAGDMIAMDRLTGGIDPAHSAPVPCALASSPVLHGGRWWYAGTDGRIYASGHGSPGTDAPAPRTDGPESRMIADLSGRLEPDAFPDTVAVLRPYVPGAPHEDGAAFTVFRYLAPAPSSERTVTVRQDGPGELLVHVYDEAGTALVSNSDEFGSHANFRYWFEAGRAYHIAVGRKAPSRDDPPAFLRVD